LGFVFVTPAENPTMYSRLVFVTALFSLFCLDSAFAAPTVTQVMPRGLTTGGTTVVTLSGTQLDQADPSVLSPLVVRQKVLSSTATQLQLEIEVAADVAPGLHRLRLANAAGVSNAWLAGVDALPQIAFQPTVDQVPVALTGTLNGSAILEAKFKLAAGVPFVADVECRRLSGGARPVLRLLDPRGVQVAFGRYRSAPGGDARLVMKTEVAGEYTIQFHDLLYKAPASIFRLKLGDIQFASMTFPLAVQSIDHKPASFVDSNIADAPASLWQPTGAPDVAVVRPADNSKMSGPMPQVVVSGYPEWVEGTEGTLPAAPMGLNGRLDVAKQVDKFRVPVTAGQTLRFQVMAHKAGSPIDAVLAVQAVGGAVLGQNDDSGPRTDPVVQAKIPANVTEVDVTIRDLTGRGGPQYIYRVAVEPVGEPAFGLKVAQSEIGVPDGGRQLLRVTVQRRGYNGPINLSALNATGESTNLSIENAVIPPGASQAIVMLRRSVAAAEAILLRGQGEVNGQVIEALANVDANTAQNAVVPGASHDLASWTSAAPSIKLESFAIPAKPYRGQKVTLPVTVQREGGGVRLRLVSSQPMPKKKIKENNTDKEVNDVDRALRIEGATMLAADVSSGEVQMLIPTDLPAQPWQVALVVEQLSADGKSVVGTTYSPVSVVETVDPYRIEMSSAAEIVAFAGEGEAGKFTGTIHRIEGFAQAVTVTLQGLPMGYEAPKVVVPGDATEFELQVKFSDKAKPAKLDKVQLVANFTPDDKKPQQTFKSNVVAVKVDVQAALKTEP
jgi:hypothetical protein